MNHFTNILLKKPDISSLRKAGFTATDFHFHSRYSDTFTRINSILKRAAKLGINVAITDHNCIDGARLAYNNRLKVNIIPGMEVSCFEGEHVLVYFSTFDELKDFFEAHIKNRRIGDPWSNTFVKTKELLDACKSYNCLTVAAHPFALGYYGIQKNISRGFLDVSILKDIDAIEAICGSNLRSANLKAIEFIKERDMPFTGGSDGHNLAQLGDVVVCTRANTTIGILKEIKQKKNIVIGTESKWQYRFLAASKSFIRHSPYIRYSFRWKYSNLYKKSFYYYKKKVQEKLP